jgi:hypothetical protein
VFGVEDRPATALLLVVEMPLTEPVGVAVVVTGGTVVAVVVVVVVVVVGQVAVTVLVVVTVTVSSSSLLLPVLVDPVLVDPVLVDPVLVDPDCVLVWWARTAAHETVTVEVTVLVDSSSVLDELLLVSELELSVLVLELECSVLVLDVVWSVLLPSADSPPPVPLSVVLFEVVDVHDPCWPWEPFADTVADPATPLQARKTSPATQRDEPMPRTARTAALPFGLKCCCMVSPSVASGPSSATTRCLAGRVLRSEWGIVTGGSMVCNESNASLTIRFGS